jgi:mannosyl-3-phosphoglycerate phosphatase
MRVGIVLTDLDGTLLEPDGTVHADVLAAIASLGSLGVPVCPVTSKTSAEIAALVARLGLTAPAGFENGAGVRTAEGDLDLAPGAVPVRVLRGVLAELRDCTGVRVRSLEELDDTELAAVTELSGLALQHARERVATLPLLAPTDSDEVLRAALPREPLVRLLRGNRFLHLQGLHDKADLVPRLRALAGSPPGAVVACGDAPNDAGLLACAEVAVIVPSVHGPHPELVRRFPDAVVAPFPHGRGWAAAVGSLVAGGRA